MNRARLREKLRRVYIIFWIYRFYIIKRGQLYLHPVRLQYCKIRSKNRSKPALAYIEMHLTTHCNIKCKGCSQFSPIAEEWFADIGEHERDMKRLAALFSNIETIRLLGGEPLLHPEVESFLYVTRNHFRKANICIATNGILLNTMKESFWEACRVNNIKINWTVYPPLFNKRKEILSNVESRGIIISAEKYSQFRSILNIKGDSDPEQAFKFCRSLYFCPFLRNGKIYMCSRPVVIKYFNNKFGRAIPAIGSIDFHDPAINGWDVLISIVKSSDTCRFCATRLNYFDWECSAGKLEDWNTN